MRGGLVVWVLAALLPLSNAADLLQPKTKCLGLPERTPKRYVSDAGTTLTLTLGTSNRVTHKLITHVFAIFLKEVLRYPEVRIETFPDYNISAVFDSLSSYHENDKIPERPKTYMVNLEVWLPSDFNTIHLLERNTIKECGNVAPPGRYGWFIPKNLSRIPSLEKIDDWMNFKSIQKAKVFSLNDEDKRFVKGNKVTFSSTDDDPNGSLYCPEEVCRTGYYTPPWCIGNQCAVLIAEFQANTMFVIEDIQNQKLFVEVIWVGDNILKVAKELETRYRYERHKSLVYLSQTPSPLTMREDFISVSFPPCDEYSNSSVIFNCHYSNIRLVKLAWSKLDSAAKPAYEAVQKMEFTQADYRELINDYLSRDNPDAALEDIACKWMKEHEDSYNININSWHRWEVSDDDRDVLLIGGIFPLNSNRTNSFTARGIVVSSLMAIEAVNNNRSILKDYRLDLLLDDGKCLADEVMRVFIDYIKMQYYNKLVGILGPACSDTVEPLAGVSKHFKTMVISYSAEGSSFSRDKYPYFFRTIGENKQYRYVYLELMKLLQWTRVASLTEDGTKYTEYISLTQDLLQKHGIGFVANRKFPGEWEKDAMKQYLEELKTKNARIIIADIRDEAARAVMCEAYHMKMTAYTGWVWFLPHWLSANWFNVTLSKDKLACTTEEMRKAINGHFSITHSYYAPDDAKMQENMTVGAWRNEYRERVKSSRDESNYAGYAYDAIWVYALALDRLIKMNESYVSSIHDENTTRHFVKLIQNTSFDGVSGHIQFSTGSSRLSNVNILQWVNGEMNVIGTFFPNRTLLGGEYENGSLHLDLSKIRWLNDAGVKPWDGTPEEELCVLQYLADALNSSCQTAIIVANIIGIAFLILAVIISIVIVKHKYDKKVEITEKYMKHLGIDLLSPSTINSLDKWEIPKDRIVINRKLGEGAFGFVYGGEAYFDEKGWVAVAVKTLKAGSSTEEKLDFLSEAEVMKRFDHKNIVQLLGVCTKNPKEPLLTVMEFMLYGDLKTFLLGRRHLVNEKYPDECDEISSKKLTNMALDVARALSYLAEKKYVHRDIASRNCLVNVNKVVKLGDFGMTRPTCENDYYRFNRKGMLPVRWMAPESLVLGIFTPASDVWSYGVLLYEIITFGSFPFQGMSNNQVLEYVKAGNTLNIPTGVKPLLECLIKSCWHKDSKKRPPASEIVEYIANNPRLLTPCIDVPLSSVQMEDTGEITLTNDKTRKFSKGLRQRSLSHEIAEPLLPSPTRYKTVRGSSLGEEPQDSEL